MGLNGSTVRMFDWYNCNRALLDEPEKIRSQAVEIAGLTGLRVIGSSLFYYPEGGSLIVIALAESHIRLEIWPGVDERGYVNGEVQLCHFTQDNRELVHVLYLRLQELLNPDHVSYHTLERGPWPVGTPRGDFIRLSEREIWKNPHHHPSAVAMNLE